MNNDSFGARSDHRGVDLDNHRNLHPCRRGPFQCSGHGGTLTGFRWIETKMPMLIYAHHSLRFFKGSVMSEPDLRNLITSHGFSIANLSYSLTDEGKYFEYFMVIRTRGQENMQRLTTTLTGLDSVVEFSISPTGD